MKKILYILLFSISILTFAQGGPNRFMEEESLNTDSSQDLPSEEPANFGIGNPAGPAPIDDYIPILVITAVGLIVLFSYKKKPSL